MSLNKMCELACNAVEHIAKGTRQFRLFFSNHFPCRPSVPTTPNRSAASLYPAPALLHKTSDRNRANIITFHNEFSEIITLAYIISITVAR